MRTLPILLVGIAFFYLGACQSTPAAEADTVAAGDTVTTVAPPDTFTFDLYRQGETCWYDLRDSDVDTVFSAKTPDRLHFRVRGGSSFYVRVHPWVNQGGQLVPAVPPPDSAIFNDVWKTHVTGSSGPTRVHQIAIACCEPEDSDDCVRVDAHPASDSAMTIRSAGGPRMKVQE